MDLRLTEGRRVQIATEMVQNGDYVVTTLSQEITLAKPPLHYWVLAGVERVVGMELAWLRLPSVLAVWLFAVAAFAAMRGAYGRAAAWVSALGVLTAPAITYHSGLAEIDPVFAGFTALAVLWLGRALAERRDLFLLGAAVAGAAALLTKGVPLAMFFAGPLLVWFRHRGWRHAVPRLAWFVPVMVAPLVAYYLLLQQSPRIQGEELADVAAEETVGRLLSYEWKHITSIPGYLLKLVAVVLPLGCWTLTEFRGRREARVEGRELMLRVLTASMVGAAAILLVFPGRPTRYLLPGILTYVAAVGPAAAAFALRDGPLPPLQRAVPRVAAVFGAMLLLVVPWLPWPFPGGTPVLGVGLLLGGFLVRRRRDLVAYALVVPVLVTWTVLADWHLRTTSGYRSPEEVGVLLRTEVARRGIEGQLAVFGHIPGGVLVHADLVHLHGDEFQRRRPDSPWLLMERRDEDSSPLPDGYVLRYRVRTRNRDVCLLERSPR